MAVGLLLQVVWTADRTAPQVLWGPHTGLFPNWFPPCSTWTEGLAAQGSCDYVEARTQFSLLIWGFLCISMGKDEPNLR